MEEYSEYEAVNALASALARMVRHPGGLPRRDFGLVLGQLQTAIGYLGLQSLDIDENPVRLTKQVFAERGL